MRNPIRLKGIRQVIKCGKNWILISENVRQMGLLHNDYYATKRQKNIRHRKDRNVILIKL